MFQATHCRSCSESSLELILEWELPAVVPAPTNSASAAGANVREQLAFCGKCALVQRVSSEVRDTSSRSAEVRSRSELNCWPIRQLTSQVIASQKLRPTSLVMQVGSREGRLLTEYQRAGIPVLGIEPAVRLAELARLEHGVPTLCRRFDRELAGFLLGCGQQADVVHLSDLLSAVEDPNVPISGLPTVLKDSGVAVMEVPYVRHLIDRGNLWSPHHTDLSYFSLTSLQRLLSRHGLVIHDVERTTDGGTSLRLFVGKRGETSARVADLLTEENGWGVDQLTTYLPQRHAKVA